MTLISDDTHERRAMSTQEFADCLDRWGANLASWPEPRHSAGNDLLNASARARELLTEAQALERWLAIAADHQAPIGLARKIVYQVPAQDFWQHAVDWLFAAVWRPAAAATCMLLIGFAVGLLLPEFDDDAMLDDVSMLAFSSTYEEFDDAQQ